MIQTFKSQQRGGTTMGVVLGVVLGLAVALGVSMYLAFSGAPIQTKGVNNAARIEPPKDVANAPDPNAALYTKVPKADDAKASDGKASDGKAEPKASDTKTVTKETGNDSGKTDAIKPATSSQKPETDGIGKIAAIATPAPTPVGAVTAAPSSTSVTGSLPSLKIIEPKTIENIAMPKVVNGAAAGAGERYFVQAGAFVNTSEAEAMKAKLALQGVAMSLSPRDRDGQILQRVRTAPLAAADAEKLRNNLKANGIETSLVKVQ